MARVNAYTTSPLDRSQTPAAHLLKKKYIHPHSKTQPSQPSTNPDPHTYWAPQTSRPPAPTPATPGSPAQPRPRKRRPPPASSSCCRRAAAAAVIGRRWSSSLCVCLCVCRRLVWVGRSVGQNSSLGSSMSACDAVDSIQEGARQSLSWCVRTHDMTIGRLMEPRFGWFD